MSTLSTQIAHNAEVDGGLTRVVVPFKSRWPGDRNQITGFHLRVNENDDTELRANEGAVDVGNLDVSVSAFTRPPLAHYDEDGIYLRGGNGYAEIDPGYEFDTEWSDSYQTVTLMVRPIGGTVRISTTDTMFTLTSVAGGYNLAATNGGTAYVNGILWSDPEPFPFNRLVTLVFSGVQHGAVQFGNSWNGTGAVDEMVINRVALSDSLTAGQIKALANRVYRSPESANVLTDLGAIGLGTDVAVTLPESWIVVSTA